MRLFSEQILSGKIQLSENMTIGVVDNPRVMLVT